MTFLISILVLAVLIFVHELGHFLVAKWCGVGVLEFSIGFGKKIFRKRYGDTWYCIGIIPLGGYVRMVGDDPRLLPYAPEQAIAEKELAAQEGAPPLDEVEARLLSQPSTWFLRKPYLPKSAIVLAGPGFNVIFAVILSVIGAVVYGKPLMDPVIGEVVAGLPGAEAGLQKFDRVRAVDGTPVTNWFEMSRLISTTGGREFELTYSRPSNPDALGRGESEETRTVRLRGVPPPADIEGGAPAVPTGSPQPVLIGVRNLVGYEDLSLSAAVVFGTKKVWLITKGTVVGLWQMIRGSVPASSIRGPIFIFGTAAKSAERGAASLIDFMVFLSISLAILNLLPIPILDGGHLLFFSIEALKGSPVNVKVLEYANQFGMVVLMLLMAFAMGNDLLDVFR